MTFKDDLIIPLAGQIDSTDQSTRFDVAAAFNPKIFLGATGFLGGATGGVLTELLDNIKLDRIRINKNDSIKTQYEATDAPYDFLVSKTYDDKLAENYVFG